MRLRVTTIGADFGETPEMLAMTEGGDTAAAMSVTTNSHVRWVEATEMTLDFTSTVVGDSAGYGDQQDGLYRARPIDRC